MPLSLDCLMAEFQKKVKASIPSLAAVPNPVYQKSVILDRLIWEQEKLLKGDEELPFSREDAYLAAKIPQYFLR
jgi:hypothetical protein